jgi:hypothetical protein
MYVKLTRPKKNIKMRVVFIPRTKIYWKESKRKRERERERGKEDGRMNGITIETGY